MNRLNQLKQKAKDREIKEHVMQKKAKRKTKKKQRGVPPSSYVTVPYYFPMEQVDIVNKLRRRKRKGKNPPQH